MEFVPQSIAATRRLVGYTCPLTGEMSLEEVGDARPPVVRSFESVRGAIGGEERVAGAVVAVELEGLAQGRQYLFELIDLRRARCLVVVAEQSEHRTAQIRQPIHGFRYQQGESGGWRPGDIRPIAVDRGVHIDSAGGEHRLPTAGAVADDADATVRRIQ